MHVFLFEFVVFALKSFDHLTLPVAAVHHGIVFVYIVVSASQLDVFFGDPGMLLSQFFALIRELLDLFFQFFDFCLGIRDLLLLLLCQSLFFSFNMFSYAFDCSILFLQLVLEILNIHGVLVLELFCQDLLVLGHGFQVFVQHSHFIVLLVEFVCLALQFFHQTFDLRA